MEDPTDPTETKKSSAQKELARPGQGDEDHRQQEAAQNEPAALITIGQVPHRGLNDECQESTDTGNDSHLGQGEVELVDESGKQRTDERTVEIPGEVHQGDGEDHPEIGRGGAVAHFFRLFP